MLLYNIYLKYNFIILYYSTSLPYLQLTRRKKKIKPGKKPGFVFVYNVIEWSKYFLFLQKTHYFWIITDSSFKNDGYPVLANNLYQVLLEGF
jgi:hypothetical protein